MKYRIGDIVVLTRHFSDNLWNGAEVTIEEIRDDHKWPYVVSINENGIEGIVSEEEVAYSVRRKISLIQNGSNRNLWWNEAFGWAEITSASIFTPLESATLNLPIEGKWVGFAEQEKL